MIWWAGVDSVMMTCRITAVIHALAFGLARPSRSVRRASQLRHGGEECIPSLVIIVIIIIVIVVINGAEPAGS
jgi:hypothetical protein